jgi:hypothetical protein
MPDDDPALTAQLLKYWPAMNPHDTHIIRNWGTLNTHLRGVSIFTSASVSASFRPFLWYPSIYSATILSAPLDLLLRSRPARLFISGSYSQGFQGDAQRNELEANWGGNSRKAFLFFRESGIPVLLSLFLTYRTYKISCVATMFSMS